MPNKQLRDYLAIVLFPLLILGFSVYSIHATLAAKGTYTFNVPLYYITNFIAPLVFAMLLARIVPVSDVMYQKNTYLFVVLLFLVCNLLLLFLPLLWFRNSFLSTQMIALAQFFLSIGHPLFQLSQQTGLLSGVYLL